MEIPDQEAESWWRRLLEPAPSNETSHGNKTGDVLCANCISVPDSIACLRSGIIAVFALLSTMVAVARIVKLHSSHPSYIHLLLYYTLCVHCIAGSFEWLLGWTTQLALAMAYAKAIELLIICYFYLDLVSKMMHWSSVAGRRLCFTSLFLMFTYFTLFLVMGLLLSIEPWTDCHAPYWIWFSAGEFLIVQLTVGSFYLILRRMSRISASSSIQRSQRIDLFSLFWTFETSAVADLGYHVSLFLLADDHKGCSGVFNHDQIRYSALKAPYDLFSFLLPVWAILYVFRTSSNRKRYDEVSTEFSQSSGRSSIVTIPDVVVVRNWRRRYRPLTQPAATDRPVLPGRRPRQQRLRQVASAPQIHAIRRQSVSRSLVSSPLYSIPEEMQQHYEYPLEEPFDDEVLVGSVDRYSTAPLIDDE